MIYLFGLNFWIVITSSFVCRIFPMKFITYNHRRCVSKLQRHTSRREPITHQEEVDWVLTQVKWVNHQLMLSCQIAALLRPPRSLLDCVRVLYIYCLPEFKYFFASSNVVLNSFPVMILWWIYMNMHAIFWIIPHCLSSDKGIFCIFYLVQTSFIYLPLFYLFFFLLNIQNYVINSFF